MKKQEDHYFNKLRKCYCLKYDKKDCYNKNTCKCCTLEYATYFIDNRKRNSYDSASLRKTNSYYSAKSDSIEIHSECFFCENYKPSRNMWHDYCSKYEAFCCDAKHVCNKYNSF